MSLYTCNSSINTLQKFNRICISTISLNGSDGSYALAIKFEVMLELRESCKPSWQPYRTTVIIVSVLKFLHCDGLNTFCRHRVRGGFFSSKSSFVTIEVVAYCYKINSPLLRSLLNGKYTCQCVKCPLRVTCWRKKKNNHCVKKEQNMILDFMDLEIWYRFYFEALSCF